MNIALSISAQVLTLSFFVHRPPESSVTPYPEPDETTTTEQPDSGPGKRSGFGGQKKRRRASSAKKLFALSALQTPQASKQASFTRKVSNTRANCFPLLPSPFFLGCYIEGQHYREGAQIPSEHGKPCEVCYCIRNTTACTVQECTLQVGGCAPLYTQDSCCPTRYNCCKCAFLSLITLSFFLITLSFFFDNPFFLLSCASYLLSLFIAR